ncbi:MAG: hypothetical protein VZS44_09720 [Bacilli bacterium]|nr:hypothetical protein [Bacilli bacterium]
MNYNGIACFIRIIADTKLGIFENIDKNDIFNVLKRIADKYNIEEILDDIEFTNYGLNYRRMLGMSVKINDITYLKINDTTKFKQSIINEFESFFDEQFPEYEITINVYYNGGYYYGRSSSFIENAKPNDILNFLLDKEEELELMKSTVTSLDISDIMHNVEDNLQEYEVFNYATDIKFDYENNRIVGRFFGGVSNWDFDENNYSDEELDTLRQDYCDAEIPTEKASELINKFIWNMRNKQHIIVNWENYYEKAYSEFEFLEPAKAKVIVNTFIKKLIEKHIIPLGDYSKYDEYKNMLGINRSDTEVTSILQNCIKYGQCSSKQFKYVKFACLMLIDILKENK